MTIDFYTQLSNMYNVFLFQYGNEVS